MNSIELDIKEKFEINERELWLNVKIDGEEFLRRIDNNLNAAIFEEIENSLTGNGEYLIFTCSCGVADCGGWKKVKIVHLQSKITWTFDYDDFQYYFEFDTQNYNSEIVKMRLKITENQLRFQPEFIMDPEL
jgi:hypothetical protein